MKGAEEVCAELNKSGDNVAQCAQMDATDWNSQAKVFGQAVHAFGRVDYVYSIAGVGERAWMQNDPMASGFEAPDLTVLDVDLKGLMYTVSLAIQQFRKQEPKNGFRGKSKITATHKMSMLTPSQSDVLRRSAVSIAVPLCQSTRQPNSTCGLSC